VTRRKGHHQPLVSPETFESIQDRLRQREHLPTRKDLNKDFPLRGFVLCASCRRPYTASWNRGKRKAFPYYRCLTEGCPHHNKSVRADRMHAEFEKTLRLLNPRQALLDLVKAELLSEWQRRMLDVEVVRKERQRKLDAIQREIDGYVEAISMCHNPTVLKKIEEEVEALEARRLRLGGAIDAAKDWDFEAALTLVFDFIATPLRMWTTGDLGQRRLVLRLVFQDPLVYERGSGFQTPSFTLPMNLACVLELDRMEMVDQIRKSWNTLESVIREWAELLRGLRQAA
jgi:hypothetical protein